MSTDENVTTWVVIRDDMLALAVSNVLAGLREVGVIVGDIVTASTDITAAIHRAVTPGGA